MATVDFEAYLAFDYDGGKPFDVDMLLGMEDEAGIEVAVVMPANNGPARRAALRPARQPAPRAGDQRQPALPRLRDDQPDARPGEHQGAVRDHRRVPLRRAEADGRAARLRHRRRDRRSGDGDGPRAQARRLDPLRRDRQRLVHPNRIANVAARFPEVPIIMDHMGYPDATEDAIRVAEEHPNIYLGTTILRFFKPDPSQAVPQAVADAVRRVGPERVVWGSNLPEYPHSALWCRQAIERLQARRRGRAADLRREPDPPLQDRLGPPAVQLVPVDHALPPGRDRAAPARSA